MEAPPLGGGNCLGGGGMGAAGLHLDEDNGGAGAQDQVDLTLGAAPADRQRPGALGAVEGEDRLLGGEAGVVGAASGQGREMTGIEAGFMRRL